MQFSGPDRDGHKKTSWRVFLERNNLLEEVPGKKQPPGEYSWKEIIPGVILGKT